MIDLPAEIASLSDEGAIRALERVAERYLRGAGVEVRQMAAVTMALIELEAPDAAEVLRSPTPSDAQSRSVIARKALAAMLDGGEERAIRLVREALIDAARARTQAEPITMTIAGGFFLALAVASKVSYSKE